MRRPYPYAPIPLLPLYTKGVIASGEGVQVRRRRRRGIGYAPVPRRGTCVAKGEGVILSINMLIYLQSSKSLIHKIVGSRLYPLPLRLRRRTEGARGTG